MYEPLTAFLLRAPLLRERELGRAREALVAHELGAAAIELASGALSTAADSAARRRALERYGRRAAFRATPSGLLAGVCVGALDHATRVATGTPVARLAPTWARVAALGRALLDDEALRARVRLRAAPSLARSATSVRWLAPGAPFAEERVADLDDGLAAILDAAAGWTTWPQAHGAARAAARGPDAGDLDELLLLLVDDGVLQADVTPPLVGPDASTWMRARLRRLGAVSLARAFGQAVDALALGELDYGAAALAALPGAAASDAGVHGVLVHRPRRPPTLERGVVERAAALAPLLFRLQEVLAPPASERMAQPALEEALDSVTELFGTGALDLDALAAGEYGSSPAGDEGERGDGARTAAVDPRASGAPPAVLTLLVDAIVAAARERRADAALDADALAAALGEVGPAPPATCELFLAPATRRRGAAPGTDWLLGLHAPAGASWGRFAAALGAPMAQALERLAATERDARPDEEALDVAFAPSPALADLCVHPRVRRRALALSTWGDADAPTDLAPGDLELVADPAAALPLGLRARAGGALVVPSPLARVRSSTAPAGTMRLLCGWSLFRQHAPWALSLGPLAALEHVPRLTLDGFVVSPASWRVPEALRAGPADRARLRRWRLRARLPRFVQVGHEDQLLAVDLAAPDAAADLVGQERAWEIWPPLGRGVDHDGRRVEAVCALVDRPDDAGAHARAARAVMTAPRVEPPRRAPPAADWLTFKVFGAPEHQDALLGTILHPAIVAARLAGELTGWFFQRYVEGPGRRHHLRLRVRAPGGPAAFAARLAAALEPARAAGAVVTLESGDYHAERARFGAALDAVHEIFESDSEAACALLGASHDDGEADATADRVEQLVRALDALARGLGLDLAGRHALARARRDAAGGPPDDDTRADDDAEFRARARQLRALLGASAGDDASRALGKHETRTARAVRALEPDARAGLAPVLLHLACVRHGGPDRDLERRAYTFWGRTLEGLRRAPPAAPRS